MPRALIAFGLALIVAVVLLKLVAFVIAIAIPLGLLLIAAGVVWHLLQRS
jgi:hypothetical protein